MYEIREANNSDFEFLFKLKKLAEFEPTTSLMTIEGKETQVSSGDMIVNKRFGTHGLVNTSSHDIELLIIQASLK